MSGLPARNLEAVPRFPGAKRVRVETARAPRRSFADPYEFGLRIDVRDWPLRWLLKPASTPMPGWNQRRRSSASSGKPGPAAGTARAGSIGSPVRSSTSGRTRRPVRRSRSTTGARPGGKIHSSPKRTIAARIRVALRPIGVSRYASRGGFSALRAIGPVLEARAHVQDTTPVTDLTAVGGVVHLAARPDPLEAMVGPGEDLLHRDETGTRRGHRSAPMREREDAATAAVCFSPASRRLGLLASGRRHHGVSTTLPQSRSWASDAKRCGSSASATVSVTRTEASRPAPRMSSVSVKSSRP